MAHKHSIYDTDPHFKIDPATRAIQNESGKVKLMQYDHKSERFTFEIPRFIDGHDMSLCNLVTIDFDNVDSSTKVKNSDIYEVKDLQLSPASEDVVIFSWLIEDSATQFKGELKFSISFQCIADNGAVDYDFGTDIHYGITIGERLRNAASVVEKGSNILSQWKADLFGIGDTEEAKLLSTSQEQQSDISEAGQTQVDAVNARGAAVLETIPDDYEALSALADENARIKAGAIVSKAEGESIAVADSANAYLSGMRLYGKSNQKSTTGINIFPQQSVEFTQELVVDLDTTYPAGKYTFSAVVKSTDTDSSIVSVMFKMDGEHVDTMFVNRSNGTDRIVYTGNVKGAFDRISFYASDGWGNSANDTATLTDILLTAGETVYEFEPYSGGKPSPSPEYPQEIENVAYPTVNVFGKNWLRNEFEPGYSETVRGVTFTVNADKSIRVSGTPTAAIAYNISQDVIFPAGVYYLSGAPDTAYTKFRLQVNPNINGTERTGAVDVGPGSKMTLEVDAPVRSYIYVASDAGTVDGVFYPQLEPGTQSTEYEPYKGQTLSLSRTLPGIPVSSGGNYTDSNGQQWICDEVDFERGVYIQRVNHLTLSATNPKTFVGSDDHIYYPMSKYGVYGTHVYCSHYTSIGFNSTGASVKFAGFATVEEFNEFITANSVEVVYILATPIETPLSDAELLAFKALRSNKPTTTILNDSGMFMSVDYVADTKTYIDNKIAEIVKNS